MKKKGWEKLTERNKARNRESKNGHPHNVDDHADDMKNARADTSVNVLCNTLFSTRIVHRKSDV